MKNLMIQGTMSNVGKSFITAGILRVLNQDGFKVAPFKSQNMALNSYITKDGKEIGRAQAMQAEAANIEPSVYINPILLKPNSHTGSQVIVNGKVIGNMRAMDYYKNKKIYIPEILNAYNNLEREYDIIVVEGAGSPAEINLKDNDIVNMGLAKMIKSPVVLVGDIDRGGVFASLYGTVKLLEEDERRYIKGIIINKFRGDIKILTPGLKMIEEKLGIPVIGTIPMDYIDIDDEDSLSERLNKKSIGIGLDVAIIRLAHISNFTDFSAFERISNVSIRYVKSKNELGTPDLIILPGSKNTIEDLLVLRQNGLEGSIKRAYEKGSLICGICGGFQMLGNSIRDSYGVESKKEIKGLELLNIETDFHKEKITKQRKAKLIFKSPDFEELEDKTLDAYEIHMGCTKGNESSLFLLDNGKKDGYISKNEKVFGTYLHGIFDNENFTLKICELAAKRRNIKLEKSGLSNEEYKKIEYDKLADLIRENIDMKIVYEIINRGI